MGRIGERYLTARFPHPPVRTVHATLTAHGSREREGMVTSIAPGFHHRHGGQLARSLGTVVPFPSPLPQGLRPACGLPTRRLLCPLGLPAGPRSLRCGSPLPPRHSPCHPWQALPCAPGKTHTARGRWRVPLLAPTARRGSPGFGPRGAQVDLCHRGHTLWLALGLPRTARL